MLDTRCILVAGQRGPHELGRSLATLCASRRSAVVDLVVAAGLFSREEAQFLAGGALDGGEDGSTCLVVDAPDGQGLASVVYYRPEEAAERAYDLTMIAVRPDLQGGRRGAALMSQAEDDLRGRGQRLVIVRTSGTVQYDRTREFYRGLGYCEHSPVPDYWSDGDDLVLFTKRLSG